MNITNVEISKIRPYEKNPRFNDNAVEAVAKSIQEFGWRSPIVVDKDMVVICGHTRLKAAESLGLSEVPIHIADNLTPEQIKAYRIADNKTSELAEWNFDLLPIELQELQEANFDLSLLCFDADDLDELLNGDTDLNLGETDVDVIPEIPEVAVSQTGEIYQLGNHRLMCGDATSSADIAKLCNGDEVDLWLTDPPYNVNYSNSLGQSIANDNLGDSEFREFLKNSYQCVVDVLKSGGSYYIFHADTEGYNFRGACRDVGLIIRECLVWVKNALVLGRCDYHFRHEPILYGWKGGGAHGWYSDRSQTTVLEFKKPSANIGHPTSKPVELLVYLIKNSSKRKDIVIDTFGGSGSTLMACEQTNRNCYMMELDPKYCDVIRKRYAEFIHGEGCDWVYATPLIIED